MKCKIYNPKKETEKLTMKDIQDTLYRSLNRRGQLEHEGIETDAQIKEMKELDFKIIKMNFELGDREQDIDTKKHRYKKTIVEYKNYMKNSVKYKIYQEDEKLGEEVQYILNELKTRLNN